VTGTSFNDYYASISNDTGYQCPLLKHTATSPNNEFVSEWAVFKMLDSLWTTATGSGLLPSWFLKLTAPVLCKPTARLFNMSLHDRADSVEDWETAYIRPVLKVTTSKSHANFLPSHIHNTNSHKSHAKTYCPAVSIPIFYHPDAYSEL